MPIGGKALPPPTPEQQRVNELVAMIHAGYAPGVTAEVLAAAKFEVFEEEREYGGEVYIAADGGESVLHEAARFGNYPPGTTLEILAQTQDARRTSALEVAFEWCRDMGPPLPPGATGPALLAEPACIWQ
jgi:hypothetical protein